MSNDRFKFRAWHKDSGQMIYREKASYPFSWIEEGQPFVLMQWTGLLDKNGREIYEGDLLKYEMGSIWEVIFEDGCFKRNSLTARYGSKKLLLDSPEQFEIIGNIHENPELLK